MRTPSSQMLGCLLLAAPFVSCVANGGALLDVYSNKEAAPLRTSGVSINSVALSPAACADAEACLAQCSTDQLLNQDPATVQAQLIQCTNNIRLAPSLFQSDISAVCNFDDVQGAAVGLNALRSSPALSSVAQAHSDDEAAQNYFSHFSSNGSSPYDRVHSMVPNADFVSELTAAGWPSVRSVLVQLVCSAKHRRVLMSCAYDSIGWGAHFGAAASPQQQWQTYFTADFVCETAAGCTCHTTWAQPAAAAPAPQLAVPATGQSMPAAAPIPVSAMPLPGSAVPNPLVPPPTPTSAAPNPVSSPSALASFAAPLATSATAPATATSPAPGLSAQAPADPAPSVAPAPLVAFDAAVVPMVNASSSDIKASLIAAIQSAAAPVPVTITVAVIAPTVLGQRRLLQAKLSMQASVTFTVGNLTTSMSEADLTAVVAHDVAIFLQPLAMAISATPLLGSFGSEYAFTILLPPDDQLADSSASSGSLEASRLTDALQNAPLIVLPSLAAVSAFTIASAGAKITVVQAQAGPASTGVVPPLPLGLLAAPMPPLAAPPATPLAASAAPEPAPAAAGPMLYTVAILFPASQNAAAAALLAALQGSPSIFPATMAVIVTNAVLSSATPPAAALSTGAAIESAGGQGGSNGVSGALYATSMELCATLPLLPRTRSEEALLVAALQGMPVPLLAAADVAVVLDGAAGSNATAAVYAFGPSQPGIYLVTVTSPANYTGQVTVSLPNTVAVAPLTYLVAEPSPGVQARATAWRLYQFF